MSRTLTNFPDIVVPDLTDPQPTSSGQVSGKLGGRDLAAGVDEHDHTDGNGIRVPFSGLAADSSLQVGGNAVIDVGQMTSKPIAVGTAAIRGLFVDTADERLKFRDHLGVVRTLDWTP